MKHAALILLASFGLSAVAPAQVRLEGVLGRHFHVGLQVGGREDHRPSFPRGEGRDRHDRDYRDYRGHEGGHWQTISEEVRVPGYWREEVVPARYGWVRDHCGRLVWSVIEPGCTRRVWVPPHCETRTRRVWVRC